MAKVWHLEATGIDDFRQLVVADQSGMPAHPWMTNGLVQAPVRG